jgi:hypothetical protein
MFQDEEMEEDDENLEEAEEMEEEEESEEGPMSDKVSYMTDTPNAEDIKALLKVIIGNALCLYDV